MGASGAASEARTSPTSGLQSRGRRKKKPDLLQSLNQSWKEIYWAISPELLKEIFAFLIKKKKKAFTFSKAGCVAL